MPKEDRRIMFSNDEVYKAIYALCHQKTMKKPPPGRLHTITESDDGNQIFVHLKNDQDETVDGRKLEYSRDFIAAALMLFCRGCGIPLPKSAKKSVMVQEGTIILRVQI